MKILPIHPDFLIYLKKKRLEKKLEKQKTIFEQNPFHPSLHAELLEPKEMKIWSFRVNRKYRAVFIFGDSNAIEIIDVNNHYQL